MLYSIGMLNTLGVGKCHLSLQILEIQQPCSLARLHEVEARVLRRFQTSSETEFRGNVSRVSDIFANAKPFKVTRSSGKSGYYTAVERLGFMRRNSTS